jgi:zinc transport system permease protein
MALGIVFIGLAPGYAPDLFSYLFGNILTVPASDLLLMLILDAVIIGIVIAFYKEFLALAFDEEYSTVVDVPVEALYLLLLCMIALTVVILLRIVGMILIITLLTIPATLARQFTYDLRKMMLLAIAFGVLLTFGGLWLSYVLDLASGATIVLLGGAALLCSFGVTRIRKWRTEKRNSADRAIQ